MKTIKHLNHLKPNPGSDKEGYNYFNFVCRGCSIQYRPRIWYGFKSSIEGEINRSTDNSYLSLEEEPDNRYDKNAVLVVCRGEFFGTAGYVGKEFAAEIKHILEHCKEYRVDMIDESEIGNKEVHLILTWI